MKLTEHFALEEFEFSSTAIVQGIDNKVPRKYIPALRKLCERVLEPLRALVNEPIIISSGYRCCKLNAAVGGEKNSQHTRGEACDIYLTDIQKLKEWFQLLLTCDFDQLIMKHVFKTHGHFWIHVSCKPDPTQNRHQVYFYTKA